MASLTKTYPCGKVITMWSGRKYGSETLEKSADSEHDKLCRLCKRGEQ